MLFIKKPSKQNIEKLQILNKFGVHGQKCIWKNKTTMMHLKSLNMSSFNLKKEIKII